MDKMDLAAQLKALQINYISVFAAYIMFSDKKCLLFLQSKTLEFDANHKIQLKLLTDLFGEKAVNEQALREFMNMGFRTFIRESFEIIHDYCKISKQMKKFEGKLWYQFTRLIRNCVSHNFKFMFTPADKQKLPAKWKKKEITLNMENTTLNLEFFSYSDALDIFEEMYQFTINELN